MSSSILEIQTPRAFLPLLEPRRYLGAWGGRGSGKSHFFAEMLVERALLEPGLRAVCIREVQKSLAQSVKRLIEDKIEALGVSHKFDVLETVIKTPGDGRILFQGMQNHTADSIKSLQGYKIAWVEEAQSLSARSLKLLRPTMREDGSQIWFSWNPESPDDPVDALLRGDNADPSLSAVARVNWSDNPWFPEVLDQERRSDLRYRPDEYGHIWEGDYLTITEAVIFRNRVSVEDFETPEGVRFFYGADFGFARDPSTLVRCFVQGKTLYVDYEAGGIGVEIDNLADLYDKVPGSRQWPIKADSARPETISYMRRQGFGISAAEKWPNSVEDGVEHLRGFERIVVHTRCIETAREFRLYSYKTDRHTGDILPVIADAHNHYIDAIRYALDGYIKRRGASGAWTRLV